MKKVLIVSFFFKPCTLTPSQRVSYWAENLHSLGYWPIIITRDWDLKVSSHFDTKKKMGNGIRHVKHTNYEVYYLPFNPGILDRAYVRWGENFRRPLFLLVKLIDILLVNFTLKHTSYGNFFPFMKSILEKEGIKSLLISGAPFYLFKIGYLANKKFKINWIADYRDDWTTNEIEIQKGANFLRKILNSLEEKYEKKWVKSSEKIISVTDSYTERITKFVKREGITIENGFDDEIMNLPTLPLFDEFTIVYSGTLYAFQDIEIILGALRLDLKQGKKFNLVFLGSGFDIKEKRRIDSIIDDTLKPYVKITSRLPKEEAVEFLQRSHVLLSISYGNLKGIPSSKLYEYIGLKKPVLLCPTDKDVMESMLTDAGVGFFADTSQDCLDQINAIRKLYTEKSPDWLSQNAMKNIIKFSRKNQLQKLDGVL